MFVCKYIVCQSAKWYCKVIERTHDLKGLPDSTKSAVYHRLHDSISEGILYFCTVNSGFENNISSFMGQGATDVFNSCHLDFNIQYVLHHKYNKSLRLDFLQA